jgi:hypothetical protein
VGATRIGDNVSMDDAAGALIVVPDGDDDGTILPTQPATPEAEIAAVLQESGRLRAEIAELTAGDATPGVMLQAGAGLSAGSVKQTLAGKRSTLLQKERALRAIQERLKTLLEQQMAVARRSLDPLLAQVRRLEEGIATVNLYLGRDEQIVTLRDGAPAPTTTPITVRQMVLAMDEECLVAADQGGIDARHIDEFDRWLLAKPEHLQQVLPELKGVVVLIPRRQSRDTGDRWFNSQLEEADHQSYWLIRNGERLFRMTTDFQVGERLVPRRDEFTAMFYRDDFDWDTHKTERVPIAPGSAEWLRAEEQADATQRHYFQVALVLQGLVDRTTVFHPLPADGFSLLQDEAYFAGQVVVVSDADQVLHDGTEPFSDWLHRLNAQLRPGMRIVGGFHGEAFRRHDLEGQRGHARLHPPHASLPASLELHTLDERRPGGGLVFHYRRTDRIWDPYSAREHEAQKRASCVIYPTDDFILPFDLITVAEMKHYLGLRTERRHYIAMVPLLQAAIAAKAIEVCEEADFRGLLAREIARQGGVEVEVAEAAVPDLVDHWKLANRWHRPLRGAPEMEAKALRAILHEDQLRRRAAADRPAGEEAAVERLIAAAPDYLLIGRARDGRYLALEPEEAGKKVFCRELSTGVRSTEVKVREWVLPGTGWKRWRLLHQSEAWQGWDHAATLQGHLTGPEREIIVGQLRRLGPGKWLGDGEIGQPSVVAVTLDPRSTGWMREGGQMLTAWLWPTPPDHSGPILTGTHPLYEAVTREAHWKRAPGGRVEVTVADHSRGMRVDAVTWGAAEIDEARYGFPWGKGHGEVLWMDEAAVPQMRRDLATEAAWRGEERRLHNVVQRLVTDIRQQWVERAEAEAYNRFLEDYGDVELWEGHRKTLRIHEPAGLDGALRVVLPLLVEQGTDLAGVSVGQAVEMARTLRPTLEVNGWEGSQRYSLEVLDQVAEMRFSVEKTAEDG